MRSSSIYALSVVDFCSYLITNEQLCRLKKFNDSIGETQGISGMKENRP